MSLQTVWAGIPGSTFASFIQSVTDPLYLDRFMSTTAEHQGARSTATAAVNDAAIAAAIAAASSFVVGTSHGIASLTAAGAYSVTTVPTGIYIGPNVYFIINNKTYALSPPQKVLAYALNGAAQVTFKAPVAGNPTSYLITSSPGGFTATIPSTGQYQTAQVNGLSNGTSYTFIVQAINAAGIVGFSSLVSNAIVPTNIPAAVLGASLAAGLVFWWSASHTVNPPANGIELPSLVDLSGNNYTFPRRSGAGTGGLWVSAWSNGNPAVNLNGSIQYYSSTGSGLFAGQWGAETTISIAYDIQANPNANGQFQGRVFSNEGNGSFNSPANGSAGFVYNFAAQWALTVAGGVNQTAGSVTTFGNTNTSPNLLVPPTPPQLAIITAPGNFNLSQNQGSTWNVISNTDGGAVDPIVNTSDIILYPRPCICIGGEINQFFDQMLQGRIAEVIIHNRILSTTEIALMKTYLASVS